MPNNLYELIRKSGYFDEAWYLSRYKDVELIGISAIEHYIRVGYLLGRDPSLKFSTEFYLNAHKDVAEAKLNPLVHYLQYGINEERVISPVKLFQLIDTSLRNKKFPSPARVAIYTAVIGNHDLLLDPECVPQHCDFYVFSEANISSKVWKQRPINYFCEDNVKVARFIKLHPHLFFPDYEYSIWIDANIQAIRDLTHLLDGLDDITPIASFPHPYRNCIYDEASVCIEQIKDNREVIKSQIAKYRSMSFPENNGLWETCILPRRHNEQRCIGLMTAWWNEIHVHSRRDQISLPVALYKLKMKMHPLAPPGADLRMYPGISFRKHNPSPIRDFTDQASQSAVLWRPVNASKVPVDLVICVHNALDEVKDCLTSLLDSLRPIDRVIIVNDASDNETTLFLQQFAYANKVVTLITNSENMGYTKSANIGLKKSDAPYIVLLNSDAILSKGVIDKMVTIAEQNSMIGIIGPLSNAATWQSVPYLSELNDYSKNDLPSNICTDSINEFLESNFNGIIPFVDLVNGFCYMIRREVISKIGYLDEENFPIGYGEEDDYSLRARSAGFILCIATNCYIHHHKSKSFTSERRTHLAASGKEALDRKHDYRKLMASVRSIMSHPELFRIRNLIADKFFTPNNKCSSPTLQILK